MSGRFAAGSTLVDFMIMQEELLEPCARYHPFAALATSAARTPRAPHQAGRQAALARVSKNIPLRCSPLATFHSAPDETIHLAIE